MNIRLLTKLLPAVAAAALLLPVFPADAQVTIRVKDKDSGAPVQSVIEYQAAADRWERIDSTNASGVLRANCPGSRDIGAVPGWGHRRSQPRRCGEVELEVERKPPSDIFNQLDLAGHATGELGLDAFSEALAASVARESGPAGLAGNPGEASLVSRYLADKDGLPAAERERAATILLNRSIGTFMAIDADHDLTISRAERAAALEPRD